MTDTKFKLGEILKVSPKTKPERFWYEKVIETTPEIITEDMPEEEWADISKQGLCDNFNYEAIETFKISSSLKATHQAKIISSNLPVSGQLKFCEDDLRKVWNGAKEGGMKKVPVVIDQYGGVNIEEHWHDKYQSFDEWYKQNFNCH